MNTAGRDGVTLLELLTVLMVLGIVMMAGFPVLTGTGRQTRLSGAAQEVATALAYGQLHALNSGRETRVVINVSEGEIRVGQWVANGDLLGSETLLDEEDVEEGSFELMPLPMEPGEEYLIRLGDEERFDGVAIMAVDFGGGDLVTFDMTGIPSAGGSVTLFCDGGQVLVTLDTSTGRVLIVE